MTRTSKILSWIAAAVVAAFGLMLLLGLFVPVYTDEVGSKTQLSRTLIEGGRLITLLPQCQRTWSLPLPLSWYPAALIYHVFFSWVGLLGLRVSGLIVAFAWFAASAWALGRGAKDRSHALRRLAVFVSIQAFGVAPLTFVTARSEPILIAALGAFAIFPLAWSIDSRRTPWARLLVTGGFVILTSIFYFSHFKALHFTPFVLLSAVFTFSWRRPLWLLLPIIAVGVTSWQTYDRARAFSDCPEAPELQARLQWLSAGDPAARHGRAAFLLAGLDHLQEHTERSVEALVIEPVGPKWLPAGSRNAVPTVVTQTDRVTRVALYALFAGLPIAILAMGVGLFFRARARRSLVFANTLSACVLGHVFLSSNWNYYNAPLVIGGLAVAAVLAAYGARAALSETSKERLRPWLALSAAAVQVLAIASMIVALVHVGPRFVAIARSGGTVVPGQPAQASVFGYSREREKIRAHAARCGIAGDGAKRLVIDDATLFAFDELREPLHLIYVSDATMWGDDLRGDKNGPFLRSLGSPGIISRCAYLPTALAGRAQREGDYCCVGEADLR